MQGSVGSGKDRKKCFNSTSSVVTGTSEQNVRLAFECLLADRAHASANAFKLEKFFFILC